MAWLLGLPSFGLIALGIWFTREGKTSFGMEEIFTFTFIAAECGLSYRAFETRDDFDSSPWLAYLFSYQIRLLVATALIGGVVELIAVAAKAPPILPVFISGPLAFIFGREPVLKDLLKIVEWKNKVGNG